MNITDPLLILCRKSYFARPSCHIGIVSGLAGVDRQGKAESDGETVLPD